MLLMMSMPSAEKMPGIQSTKLTWKVEALRRDLEKVAASTRVKRARENWKIAVVSARAFDKLICTIQAKTIAKLDTLSCRHWFDDRSRRNACTHQSSRDVDACGPGVCAAHPLRLREAEESMVRHGVPLETKIV